MKSGSLFAMSGVLFMGGCASSPDPARTDLDAAGRLAAERHVPENLRPYYQRLYWEGESEATLNRMRLASAALEREEWEAASQVLDQVIRDIEALGPADPRSREALGSFTSESVKRFKGEPYERSMAYLLRGLLYMRQQAWDNARACFKSAQIQDAAKTDPALRGNWASADWLEGWCHWKLGETTAARACWERAAKQRPIPAPAPHDDAVIVTLLGFGPIKIPTETYGERLAYREGESRSTKTLLRKGTASQSMPLAEDLLMQARSRGIRHMDAVNQGKAETRAATATAGDVLIYGGSGAAVGGAIVGDTAVAASGLGAMAAGMAAKGAASAIQPQADTRTWDLLPARIEILPIRRSAETSPLIFEFLDAQGKTRVRREVEMDPSSSFILIFQR